MPSVVLAAAAAVDLLGESGIDNGPPVTRLPRLVIHQLPSLRLHLLQPHQPLSISGV